MIISVVTFALNSIKSNQGRCFIVLNTKKLYFLFDRIRPLALSLNGMKSITEKIEFILVKKHIAKEIILFQKKKWKF